MQLPQWFGSLDRFTHCPEQLVVPPVQTRVQLPFTQLWPGEHTLVQLPQ